MHPLGNNVVITGMGTITPVGNSVAETWASLKAGRSGLARIAAFDPSFYPCQVGGELKGFDPGDLISIKERRHMSQTSQIAVVAAAEALADSGLDLNQEDRDRIGVILGTAGGGCIEETEKATVSLLKEKRPSPHRVVELWPHMPVFHIAKKYRLRGYCATICSTCASASQAIGEAASMIRRGEAEIVLTGGAESMASETLLAGFASIRALATSFNQQPERAMRPFEKNREGFVSALGGSILVLESVSHAQARKAKIYGEILGCGNSNDAYHPIAPDPLGSGQILAIRRALTSAGIVPEQVDYINSHGTSTPLGDLAETRAIKAAFGQRAYHIPINSTKSMIGHMMGATGALEAIVCVLSIQEGVVHPTINYDTPDPECDLDYVPNTSRRVNIEIALSNSFGVGGQNTVLVIGSGRSLLNK
jgi:3-oxoacyl-[acyl-carrier-protein] synthase II